MSGLNNEVDGEFVTVRLDNVGEHANAIADHTRLRR